MDRKVFIKHHGIVSCFLSVLTILFSEYTKGQTCLSGGCSTFTNQYPSGTLSTTSNQWSRIQSSTGDALFNAGNYTLFSVVNGNTYEWSYCEQYGGVSTSWDAQLTLFSESNFSTPLCFSTDDCGTNSNAPYLRWTANFTGTVRILTTMFSGSGCRTNSGSPYNKMVWRLAPTCTPVSFSNSALPQDVSVNEGSSATFSVSVTGSAPYNYYWYKNGDISVQSNSGVNSQTNSYTISSVTSANSGETYKCIVSNACSSNPAPISRIATLSVNSSCTPPAAPPNPYYNVPACGTATLIRQGNVPSSETWYWQGTLCDKRKDLGSGSNFQATASGVYYLRAYNNNTNCWSATCASVNVVIDPGPTVTVTSNSPVTAPEPLTLTASSVVGATYSWIGPSGFTSNVQNPPSIPNTNSSMSGDYCVSATVGGCTGVASCTNVIVNSNTSNNITGTVYDYSTINANSLPFLGAIVELINSNDALIATTTTNSKGDFEFTNLSGSNYQLRVSSGSGANLISGTVKNLNPGITLSVIKLPYSIHKQTSNSNSSIANHEFDYTIGYIFTLPISTTAFNINTTSNYLQADFATFNDNIDKKIAALQRMLSLFNTMKIIGDNGAEMIQQTNEEIISGVMLYLSMGEFINKFNTLLNNGGLNFTRWVLFKTERVLLEAKAFMIKNTLILTTSFIDNPNLKSKVRNLIDGSFALIQDYLDSDNQNDFDESVRQNIINEINTALITPIIYHQYFIDPIQKNLDQAVNSLASLQFSSPTNLVVSNLSQVQINSGNSYANHYSDLTFWSSFAEGLSIGKKLFTLGKAFMANPYAIATTEFSSAILGLGSYASEGKAILSGLNGVEEQKQYAMSVCTSSTLRPSNQNGYKMFVNEDSNDSLHFLYLQEDTAISNLQNEEYSPKSVLEYVNVDSTLNVRIKKIMTRLNAQFIESKDSVSIDSFYHYLDAVNFNTNLRSNFDWLLVSKLSNTVDPKIDDSLSYYQYVIKLNNLRTDSILREAHISSLNKKMPAYFTIEKVAYPTITDTGSIVPVTVITSLYSDSAISAQINISNISTNVDSITKRILPNLYDTSIFYVPTGSTDTTMILAIDVKAREALETSQRIIIHIQSANSIVSISGKNYLCKTDSAILRANAPIGYVVKWKEETVNSIIGSGDSLIIYAGFPGIYRALYTDTVTSKSYYSQNDIEIKNPFPDLGSDKSVTIICSDETIDISNLYDTIGLTRIWNIQDPKNAGIGMHRLIVTNNYGCNDTALVIVKQDIQTWLGSVGENWHSSLNWSNNAIPTNKTHVIIGESEYPCILKDSDAIAASIQIDSGAIFTAINNKELFIKANCSRLTYVGHLATTTTLPITIISPFKASGGGNVIDDGGTFIKARGVCWDTMPNPTISQRSTNNGDGKGNFISSLSGLIPNTIYYVRSFATNDAGTNYGKQQSFTTPNRDNIQLNLGLVAWYQFDSNAVDNSGLGNNGTVYGATLSTDRFGKENSAYNFNGADYIQVPHSESLNFGTNNTFSFWIKASPPLALQKEYYFFAKHNPNDGITGISGIHGGIHTFGESYPNIFFRYDRSSWGNPWGGGSVPNMPAFDTWTHLVLVIGENADSIYINGVLSYSEPKAPTTIIGSNTWPMYFGKDVAGWSLSTDAGFKGQMDDIRIYNRALTSAEISVLYHEGGY